MEIPDEFLVYLISSIIIHRNRNHVSMSCSSCHHNYLEEDLRLLSFIYNNCKFNKNLEKLIKFHIDKGSDYE